MASSGDVGSAPTRELRSIELWLMVAAMIGVLGLLYRRIVPYMIHQWSVEDDYTHGFLIIPLALYFVWEKREKLAGVGAHPKLLGAGLLAAGLLTLVVGEVGAELFLQRCSLIVVVAGLVWLLDFGERIPA